MDENDYLQIKTSSESALKDQLCGRIRKKEPAIIKKKLKKDLFHQTPDHLLEVAVANFYQFRYNALSLHFPEMASSNFLLFLQLKNFLAEKIFQQMGNYYSYREMFLEKSLSMLPIKIR
jgi:hypothetical protein